MKMDEEIAKEKLILSKDNINEALTLVKDYSICVIITGNHTIVKVENLDDVVSSGTAAQMEIDKSEKEDMVTALPRATIIDESDYTPSPEMQAAMAETTVISAPVSNVTNNPTTQVVSRTVIEPDVYFIRQSSWAI